MLSTTPLRATRILLSLVLCSGLSIACGDNGGGDDSTTSATVTVSGGSVTLTTTPTSGDSDTSGASITTDPKMPKLDLPADEDTDVLPNCSADGTCNLLDILFVIDNSGSMGEEQTNLAANFPYLIQKIRDLKDKDMNLVNADVNIMVTTTDFGHPLCTTFQKEDYTPAKGAPIFDACTDRLTRFTGNGPNAPMIPQACTNGCDANFPAAPMGPFIHFSPSTNNIMGANPDPMRDAVADALSCIGPQGIDGCGMEATLETMVQALDPGKPWNSSPEPFLRPGAVLAVIVVTDEEDCATKDYKYFDPANVDDPMYNQYWEGNPAKAGALDSPTSATCWNAGVSCFDNNADGIYESCMSEDKGVLQPIERYTNYLKEVLIKGKNKQVVMLGILGVPPVTARNPLPPFEPTDGGVFDLVYRDWLDSDILPADAMAMPPKTAATKQYEFGIGPGCTNAATGQAVPPVRVKEVCESLNVPDDPSTPQNDAKLRCCIESICDTDFSNAINCLAGILQEELAPAG